MLLAERNFRASGYTLSKILYKPQNKKNIEQAKVLRKLTNIEKDILFKCLKETNPMTYN